MLDGVSGAQNDLSAAGSPVTADVSHSHAEAEFAVEASADAAAAVASERLSNAIATHSPAITEADAAVQAAVQAALLTAPTDPTPPTSNH